MSDIGAHSEIDPPRGEWDEPCSGRVTILDQSGPIWSVRCDACGWEAGLPARKADPSLRRKLRASQAGFPTRFVGLHFEQDQHNKPALRQLADWLRDYEHRALPAPAIHGPAGIGKTHMLVALCERLIRDHDAAVMFRSSARLLDELQEAFDHPGEHALIWHRALSVDVLALDDVGAERPTEWRADRLARLVDERWENERPVVLATNVPPRLWPQAFDARTASRLAGMTFAVELHGADRRQMALQQSQPEEE